MSYNGSANYSAGDGGGLWLENGDMGRNNSIGEMWKKDDGGGWWGEDDGGEREYDSLACKTYNFIMHCIVIGTLSILGTSGNVVSFIVFSRDSKKTSTSFLLQALAVIDSIFLVVVFFTYSVTTYLQWMGSIQRAVDFMIYTVPLAFVFQTAAIWMVVLIGE